MDLLANYNSSEDEQEEVKAPRIRKSYTEEFKLNVVNFARENNNHKAATKFGVDVSSVRDWKKQETSLHVIKNSSPAGKFKKKLPGNGRPLTFKDLDEQLAVWVRKRRAKKFRISHTILQQRAVQTFNSEKDEEGFKASRGWLIKFLARHKFRLRVPTTACQKPPSDYMQKIIDFILYVSEARQENNYQSIYAADETAVYFDPSGGKCLDVLGAKEVSVLTTGHDKARITVMLTARSYGKKMKPFVLLPRKRMDKEAKAAVEKYKNKLELCWKETVWMNDELTLDYLDRIFGGSLFGGKRLLVWDSFRCHLKRRNNKENSELVKKLRHIGLHTAVVPGGCTKFIQAPHVSWNGPFKAHIWMSNDAQKEYTAGGNPKAPSMDVYLDWIVAAWESLPAEAIAKSFKNVGVTICQDGSEDGEVHCFKEHGPIPERQYELMVARLNQPTADTIEEADREEDEENGYLSDESLDPEMNVD